MEFTPITAEQVQRSVLGNQITQLAHHECGLCGVSTRFLFDLPHNAVYYDSSCGCSESHPQLYSYQDVADFINMQTDTRTATALCDELHLPPPHEIKSQTDRGMSKYYTHIDEMGYAEHSVMPRDS